MKPIKKKKKKKKHNKPNLTYAIREELGVPSAIIARARTRAWNGAVHVEITEVAGESHGDAVTVERIDLALYERLLGVVLGPFGQVGRRAVDCKIDTTC